MSYMVMIGFFAVVCAEIPKRLHFWSLPWLPELFVLENWELCCVCGISCDSGNWEFSVILAVLKSEDFAVAIGNAS
jgi:hypothetical protein